MVRKYYLEKKGHSRLLRRTFYLFRGGPCGQLYSRATQGAENSTFCHSERSEELRLSP